MDHIQTYPTEAGWERNWLDSSGSECWQVAESCEHEINPKVIPWLNY